MCKINGQNIFKWMFATPLAITDEVKRQRNKNNSSNIEQQQEDEKVSNSELQQETASTTKTDNTSKNPISSLRIPLKTLNSGANTSSNMGIGLNLGG